MEGIFSDKSCNNTKEGGVDAVEGREVGAVYVYDGGDIAGAIDGHDYFGAGSAAAGYVPQELFHVGNDNSSLLLPGGAADALPIAYPQAG